MILLDSDLKVPPGRLLFLLMRVGLSHSDQMGFVSMPESLYVFIMPVDFGDAGGESRGEGERK